jgi:hypothetical protein
MIVRAGPMQARVSAVVGQVDIVLVLLVRDLGHAQISVLTRAKQRWVVGHELDRGRVPGLALRAPGQAGGGRNEQHDEAELHRKLELCKFYNLNIPAWVCTLQYSTGYSTFTVHSVYSDLSHKKLRD